MNPYHILKNPQTLETAIEYCETQKENTILAKSDNYNFVKSVFDRYPNPTQVLEGITSNELSELNQIKNSLLEKEYTAKIDELVNVHVQKFVTLGTAIPKAILDEQTRLINEFKTLTGQDLK